MKRKQEIEFDEIRRKQAEEQLVVDREEELAKMALIEKRAEYVRRTQNYMTVNDVEEKSEKSKGGSKKVINVLILSFFFIFNLMNFYFVI